MASDYIKVEEYFKSKIDWKIYNFLLDRVTEYEDIGIPNICVEVMYRYDIYDDNKGTTEYHWLYKWYMDENDYVNTNLNHLKTQYEKYGLYYSIIIYEDNVKSIINTLCDKVSGKLKIIERDDCSFVGVPI